MLPVRPKDQCVWTVFTSAIEALDTFLLVVVPVCVGIGETVNARSLSVYVYPQTSECMQKTLSGSNVNLKLLNLCLLLAYVDSV